MCKTKRTPTISHRSAIAISSPNFKASLLCCRSVENVRRVCQLLAAMQAFADYKELPADSPSFRSFHRSLLHCHTECDDLTTSIRPLSMRLDYVVGREAAHRRRTRHVSPLDSFSFFSAVDEITKRASKWASKRSADPRCRVLITSLSGNWLMSTPLYSITDLNARNGAYIFLIRDIWS